jgi:predicted nucleic-acid-binding protein
MIGLDTNVILRFVTQDHPTQSAAANRLMESFSIDKPGVVPTICVIELVWALKTFYKAKSSDIEQAVETLLRAEGLIIERSELVWQALRLFTKTSADFADCLIERCAHAEGCDHTATFDRKAVSAGMKLLS